MAAQDRPQPVADPVGNVLRAIATVYGKANTQAARLPGVTKAAGAFQRGSARLHAWADEPLASGDPVAGPVAAAGRKVFAHLYDFAVPQDPVGVVLAAIPPARPIAKGNEELRLALRLRGAKTTEDAAAVVDELERGGFLASQAAPTDAEVQRAFRHATPVAGPERRGAIPAVAEASGSFDRNVAADMLAAIRRPEPMVAADDEIGLLQQASRNAFRQQVAALGLPADASDRTILDAMEAQAAHDFLAGSASDVRF